MIIKAEHNFIPFIFAVIFHVVQDLTKSLHKNLCCILVDTFNPLDSKTSWFKLKLNFFLCNEAPIHMHFSFQINYHF